MRRHVVLAAAVVTALFLAGAVLTVNALASGTTYYFSNSTGSDSNPCSQSAPCKSLAKIQSLQLQPGDTVALLRGDSWTGGLVIGQSGSSSSRVSLSAYGSSTTRPIITGGQNGDCIRVNGSFVNVDNVEGDSCGYAGAEVFGQHVTVDLSRFAGNAAGIRVAAGTADVLITHNQLANNNILNVNTSSNSSGAFGVLLNGPAIVDHNTISGSYAPSQAYGWDGSGVELYNASNAWVHDNVMTDNEAGIEAGGSGSGNAVEYNAMSSSISNDSSPDGIILPGSVTGTWIAHNSIDVIGSSAQGIVCYSSCNSGTRIKDNAVKASLKALYIDGSGWQINGNVFNGAVQGTTPDATNSSAPIQWVNPPADLRELATSPTVDHGTVTNFATDLAGNSVPDVPNSPADTGAYEYEANPTSTTTSGTTSTTTPTTTTSTTQTQTTTTSTTPTTTTTTTTTSNPPPSGPCGTSASPPSGGYQHVVWIVMENHSYGQIYNNGAAPFETQLANECGLATNDYAISHPSLPNYIALTSGSTQGITDDNDPSSHRLGVPSIFSQLPSGASRSLEESMPSNCDQGNAGSYAVRHNPEAYYTNLNGDCGNYDVPLGSSPDLSARFTFVTPNACDDMHDCSVSTGDNWLAGFMPKVFATSQWKAGNTVVFVTFDEDDGSSGNHVYTAVVAPSVSPGTKVGTSFNHYSLLRTAEDLLGVPAIAGAGSATPMESPFNLK